MILLIDAHNIGSGGGIAHLKGILSYALEHDVGFSVIYVFCRKKLIDQLQIFASEKIIFKSHPLLNGNMMMRLIWLKFVLPKECKMLDCDLIFSPGGIVLSVNRNTKTVVMCQNVLPFLAKELAKDYLLLTFMRLLQRSLLLKSFVKADGLVFISRYGHDLILKKLGKRVLKNNTVIPLGIDLKVFKRVHSTMPQTIYRDILYVSTLKSYKHHSKVIQAFAKLNYLKNNLRLLIVGGGDKHIYESILELIKQNNLQEYVELTGSIYGSDLLKIYQQAHIFIFASSAENCPTILLEAMAVGLPIACSDRPPMPEFAQDAAVYFDPTDINSIYQALSKLIKDKSLRLQLSAKAIQVAQNYSAEKMAKDTFLFLKSVIK